MGLRQLPLLVSGHNLRSTPRRKETGPDSASWTTSSNRSSPRSTTARQAKATPGPARSANQTGSVARGGYGQSQLNSLLIPPGVIGDLGTAGSRPDGRWGHE